MVKIGICDYKRLNTFFVALDSALAAIPTSG